MIEGLVQKYGKPIIKELMDGMIINGDLNKINLRDIFIKYGLITKRTKTINNRSYCDLKKRDFIGGMFVDVAPYKQYRINIVNGKNQSLFFMNFKEQDIPHIMEVLYKED